MASFGQVGVRALRNRRVVWMSVGALVFLTLGPVAYGQGHLVRVEEDWELKVATPDVDSNSPQVVCTMTPTQGLDDLYMTFEVNHRSDSYYVAGGVNLLVWRGERHMATRSTPNIAALASGGETITWTQSLEVKNGLLTFAIRNGHSATWGSFGGSETLKVATSTSLPDLNSYSPFTSTRHSGVTFASACVESLRLKRVRFVLDDGTVITYECNQLVSDELPESDEE